MIRTIDRASIIILILSNQQKIFVWKFRTFLIVSNLLRLYTVKSSIQNIVITKPRPQQAETIRRFQRIAQVQPQALRLRSPRSYQQPNGTYSRLYPRRHTNETGLKGVNLCQECLKIQQRLRIERHLRWALSNFFIFSQNDGVWLLYYSIQDELYLTNLKPLGEFFKHESNQQAYKCSESIEKSKPNVEIREIEYRKICNPYESWMKESSKRVENDGRYQMIELMYPFADFVVCFVQLCHHSHQIQYVLQTTIAALSCCKQSLKYSLFSAVNQFLINLYFLPIMISIVFHSYQYCLTVNSGMQSLIRNIVKFNSTIINLYPLSQELTTDLLILNAYLKNYSEAEEAQLENFVQRQVKKLEANNYAHCNQDVLKQLHATPSEPYLKVANFNHNRFDFKIPLPTQMSDHDLNSSCSYFQKTQRPFSHSSGQEQESKGIKSARHKFSTRERNKVNKNYSKQLNKQNICFNVLQIKEKDKKGLSSDKSLQLMKQETERVSKKSQINSSRQISSENLKQDSKKLKIRYESNESRTGGVSSLKIKLKPKTSLNVLKIQKEVIELLEEMQSNEKTISELQCSPQFMEKGQNSE